MDWRERYADKLTTPEDAVALVSDGDRVVIGMHYQTPLAPLPGARRPRQRAARTSRSRTRSRRSSRGGRTTTPNDFTVRSFFLQASDRPAMRKGLLDYVIAPPTRSDEQLLARPHARRLPRQRLAAGRRRLVQLRHERLGRARGCARSDARHRRGERALHPHGRRQSHPRLTLREAGRGAAVSGSTCAARRRRDEEDEIAAVICSLVGSEIVQDGDTLQLGTGTVSAAMAPFLGASQRPRRALGADLRRHPGARRSAASSTAAARRCIPARSSARRSGR